jgi:hypothetical protein
MTVWRLLPSALMVTMLETSESLLVCEKTIRLPLLEKDGSELIPFRGPVRGIRRSSLPLGLTV